MMQLTVLACRILSVVRSMLRDGIRTRDVESLPLESERHSFWNKDIPCRRYRFTFADYRRYAINRR